jgi:hypothetical protein
MATLIYNRVPPVRLTPGRLGNHQSKRNTLPDQLWILPDYNRLESSVGFIKRIPYVIVHMLVRVIRRNKVRKEYLLDTPIVMDLYALRYIFQAQVVLSGTPKSWSRLLMHCTRWSRGTRNQLRRIWGRNQVSTFILW